MTCRREDVVPTALNSIKHPQTKAILSLTGQAKCEAQLRTTASLDANALYGAGTKHHESRAYRASLLFNCCAPFFLFFFPPCVVSDTRFDKPWIARLL
jgi:hypothetical protein